MNINKKNIVNIILVLIVFNVVLCVNLFLGPEAKMAIKQEFTAYIDIRDMERDGEVKFHNKDEAGDCLCSVNNKCEEEVKYENKYKYGKPLSKDDIIDSSKLDIFDKYNRGGDKIMYPFPNKMLYSAEANCNDDCSISHDGKILFEYYGLEADCWKDGLDIKPLINKDCSLNEADLANRESYPSIYEKFSSGGFKSSSVPRLSPSEEYYYVVNSEAMSYWDMENSTKFRLYIPRGARIAKIHARKKTNTNPDEHVAMVCSVSKPTANDYSSYTYDDFLANRSSSNIALENLASQGDLISVDSNIQPVLGANVEPMDRGVWVYCDIFKLNVADVQDIDFDVETGFGVEVFNEDHFKDKYQHYYKDWFNLVEVLDSSYWTPEGNPPFEECDFSYDEIDKILGGADNLETESIYKYQNFERCTREFPYGGVGTMYVGDNLVVTSNTSYDGHLYLNTPDSSGKHWLMTSRQEPYGNALGLIKYTKKVENGKEKKIEDGGVEFGNNVIAGDDVFAKMISFNDGSGFADQCISHHHSAPNFQALTLPDYQRAKTYVDPNGFRRIADDGLINCGEGLPDVVKTLSMSNMDCYQNRGEFFSGNHLGSDDGFSLLEHPGQSLLELTGKCYRIGDSGLQNYKVMAREGVTVNGLFKFSGKFFFSADLISEYGEQSAMYKEMDIYNIRKKLQKCDDTKDPIECEDVSLEPSFRKEKFVSFSPFMGCSLQQYPISAFPWWVQFDYGESIPHQGFFSRVCEGITGVVPETVKFGLHLKPFRHYAPCPEGFSDRCEMRAHQEVPESFKKE